MGRSRQTTRTLRRILGITESTVKKHVQEMFEKAGVENRPVPATVRALEVLNSPAHPRKIAENFDYPRSFTEPIDCIRRRRESAGVKLLTSIDWLGETPRIVEFSAIFRGGGELSTSKARTVAALRFQRPAFSNISCTCFFDRGFGNAKNRRNVRVGFLP